MIVTIDGPVASGKSTLGRNLAKKLNAYYLYSGLLYRSLAYLLVNHCRYEDAELRNPQTQDIAMYLDPHRFLYRYDDQTKERVFFDGQDITPHLKTSFIDNVTSILSTNKKVRDAIDALQREIARNSDVVVDGRDSGTVVFPDADYKFYITAPTQTRAQRWQKQQERLGNNFSLEQAIEKVNERDERDKNRKIAPLIIPDGAIVIDNSNQDANQTLADVLDKIQK